MKTLAGLVLLCLAAISHSDSYYTDVDVFFKQLSKGNISEAVDNLYRSNPYITKKPEQLNAIKNQLIALPNLVGELNFLEELDTYNLKDLAVHISYIATYDRQPVRFEFQFFKVKSGWRIYSFAFDAELDDELGDLAKKRALDKSRLVK